MSVIPRISICIPVYNGGDELVRLVNEILSCRSNAFELVLSDDFSTDGSSEFLKSIQGSDDRVKCYFNERNVGMDRNFSHVADHSTGEFVWFCGQDDLIPADSIERLIDEIELSGEIDFYYLNYSVQDNWNKSVYTENMLGINADLEGTGYQEFFEKMKNKVPSFLPLYVIRKKFWQLHDKEIFFGTHYVQLGHFLRVLPFMKWKVISDRLIEGLIPEDGWQADYKKRSRILIGNLIAINTVKKLTADIAGYKTYLENLMVHNSVNLFGIIERNRIEGYYSDISIFKAILLFKFDLGWLRKLLARQLMSMSFLLYFKKKLPEFKRLVRKMI